MRPLPTKLDRAKTIQLLALSHDLLAGALAVVAGLFLRIGLDAWTVLASPQFHYALALFLLSLALFSSLNGLNRGIWRYASIPDLVAIVKTSSISIVCFFVFMFLFSRLDEIPRTSLVIMWAVLILLMAGPRVAYRILRNNRVHRRSARHRPLQNAVLVGAESGSEIFIKACRESPKMNWRIVAVLDDRQRRQGLRIRGVPVVGSLDELDEIVERWRLDEQPVEALICTRDKRAIRQGRLDQLIEWAADNGCRFLHAPDLEQFALSETGANVAEIQPKPVKIEDLLGRDTASLDSEPLTALLGGASVLVTGAGGSIGGELCRQIIQFRPARLILLELSEFNLYRIENELLSLAGDCKTELFPRLADVRNHDQVLALFEKWKPDVVFHAAALKHVPIVEHQPLEGLATNVLGTRNVADASNRSGAKAMVLISTDKAVNPTSVMGCSKRMAELYCQSQDVETRTRFVTVRFGNVLGSSGSVVPLFEQQIRNGGPVTVTHPDITRFFMTIPEASQLVLHALQVALDNEAGRGHIHVLDMGEPVKIVDLARQMILLSGLRPDIDIEIAFTGLRPGEKLYEELFTTHEQRIGTSCAGVLVAAPPILPLAEVNQMIEDLEIVLRESDETSAIALVSTMVPEAQLNSQPSRTATSSSTAVLHRA